MEGEIEAKIDVAENSYINALISNDMEEATVSAIEPQVVIKRGRKPKYFSEEDRRLAKREQNRRYRDRKREELTALRRLAAMRQNDTAPDGDINIEVGEESKA